METDETETKVVFRKWRSSGGGIIALFPDEKYGDDWSSGCMSYEHIGQHGEASYDLVMAHTTSASEREYLDLKKELEGLGYKLKVLKRYIEGIR
jgi:hypothetical protein